MSPLCGIHCRSPPAQSAPRIRQDDDGANFGRKLRETSDISSINSSLNAFRTLRAVDRKAENGPF